MERINDVLLKKMENAQTLSDELIEKLTNELKLHCMNHNKIINEWFDDKYHNQLETLKKLNAEYLELSNNYKNCSFLSIDDI